MENYAEQRLQGDIEYVKSVLLHQEHIGHLDYVAKRIRETLKDNLKHVFVGFSRYKDKKDGKKYTNWDEVKFSVINYKKITAEQQDKLNKIASHDILNVKISFDT